MGELRKFCKIYQIFVILNNKYILKTLDYCDIIYLVKEFEKLRSEYDEFR